MPATIKTLRPLFWSAEQGIDYSATPLLLNDLLPAVGQATSAFFDNQERLVPGQPLQLIWCPPVSDLNGWDEQPSEIGQSQLLQVKVIGPALAPSLPAHPIHQGLQQYPLEVLACEPLLPALRAQREDPGAWQLQSVGTAHGSHLSWDRLRGCRRAEVQGLTYLTGSGGGESMMELILEVTDDAVFGLLSVHLDPGGHFHDLGRRRLLGDELRAIRQALKTAETLKDSQPCYLAI
jgi:hypothetical protein